MSLANITSRRLRVLIGPDEQDWSLAVGGLGVGRNALDESGLLPIRGQLEILPVLSAPESIDPAENPARWHPGQPVRIQVPNQAGAWVDHPQGRLFILEEPDLPEEQGGILLQLGGRLAWHDSFEFDDDQTGVPVGTATNCATVAQNLLEANEILTADISLGTWPYALTLPEGKGPAGSFVQQAGELAYSNDWRYLWQRPDGVITATALDLSIASPLVTITLGTNDLFYRRVKVEGTPPDRLKVAAVGVTMGGIQNPAIETAEILGDKSEITYDDPWFEAVQTCDGFGPISRTTAKVSWTDTEHVTTVTDEGIFYALTVTTGGWTIGSGCSLVPYRKTITRKRYDAETRRLLDTTTELWQRGFTLSEAFRYGALSSSNLSIYQLLERTVETPYPADDEVIDRIEVFKEVALWTLNPDADGRKGFDDDPARLIPLGTDVTRWKNLGGNTWQKTETKILPRVNFTSIPGASRTGTQATTSVSISGTGNNQPPRLEFWDYGAPESEIEYQATADYTLPGGTGRTRKELKTLPYGFSQGQCETLARKHLALMAGRHRAALIEFPITDALLSAPPLFPCDVVFPSGEIRHYRIDGLAWEHTEDQAKAVGTGILVGTTPAPTEENPTPTPIPATGTAVVSGAVPVVHDDAPVFALV